MTAPRKVWGVLIGAPLAVEFVALAAGRPDWTLSPQLRWALRTHTPHGAAISSLLIGAGAGALAYHLRTIPNT